MACFMLSLLVISLLWVAFSDSVGMYVTTGIKNKYGIFPNRAENFIIPDGQCSGFIDQSLLCSNPNPGVVQVEVQDNVAFPSVVIDNSLLSASIQRSAGLGGRCEEEAEVKLSFYCLKGQAAVRQRRSLRLLPPAPRH